MYSSSVAYSALPHRAQAGSTGKTHTSQPHLGGKIQNKSKKEIEFNGVKTRVAFDTAKWSIYSVIRNEGVKNIGLFLQNYLNFKNFPDIFGFLSTGHLC